ncbi:MAG: hypothetical protein EOP88_25505 [Verrucomicrobiaceae bacterium]|nr:MAG: hypothetical protein EOP88_25505 [Verrucomicrobiaceae bacterium]
MLFGHKQHFAIEACVEEGLQVPSTAWGRMCIWTEGMMIGRIDEEHCGLDYSAERLEELVEELPSLWLEELTGLNDAEIFQRFDHLLYTGSGAILEIRFPDQLGRVYGGLQRMPHLSS